MKKLWLVLCLCVLLSGCGAAPTYETIGNPFGEQVAAPMRRVELKLPQEASAPALSSNENDRIYFCGGYSLCVQTFTGGDMDATLRRLTGFGKDSLTLMQTQSDDIQRSSCVWSAAGEGGDHVGRALILDDGNYHYAVTVMAEFSKAGELTQQWQEIFDSVKLSTD